MMKTKTKTTRSLRNACLAWAVLLAPCVAMAQDAPDPAAVDAAIDKMVALDPAAVAQKIQSLKQDLNAKSAESQKLKEQAAALEAEAKALTERIDAILKAVDGLAKGLGLGAPPPAQAMAPKTGDEVMAMAPKTVGYDDAILPILEGRCIRCHNIDKQRGGLNMESFASLMDGGSSGMVVQPGQPDSSRLLRLASQVEEPVMPPSGSPLNDEDLGMLRAWIASGAPQNAGDAPMKVAKLAVEEGPVFVAAKMSDGPPPMPEVELPAPVARGNRGNVARAVATSPTSPLAAVGGDGEVILYHLKEFKVLGALSFPEGDIFTLSFSLNGELLLAGGGEEGDSGIAVMWQVRTGERVGEFGKDYDTVLAAAVSPDHRMVAVGGTNKKVRVFSAENGEQLYKLEKHTDWIYALKFTPDGEVLATADRAGNLHLWQAANGRPAEELRGHDGAIHDMDYTHDSVYLATAGEDGNVYLWDTWKFNQVRKFMAHPGGVLSLNISKDGQIVTSGKDGFTKRWDLNGKNVSTYAQLPDWSYQARFGASGSVVLAGAWNGDIAIWNSDTGEQVAKLTTNVGEPQ